MLRNTQDCHFGLVQVHDLFQHWGGLLHLFHRGARHARRPHTSAAALGQPCHRWPPGYGARLQSGRTRCHASQPPRPKRGPHHRVGVLPVRAVSLVCLPCTLPAFLSAIPFSGATPFSGSKPENTTHSFCTVIRNTWRSSVVCYIHTKLANPSCQKLRPHPSFLGSSLSKQVEQPPRASC
jgi:hypothetical protein